MNKGSVRLSDRIFYRLTKRWPTLWSIENLGDSLGLGFRKGPFYLGGRFYKEDIDKLIETLKERRKSL